MATNAPRPLGLLYWYHHDGWANGDDQWPAQKLIGHGGWHEYKRVFASSEGVIYAIDFEGHLHWYHFPRWRDGAEEGACNTIVAEAGWDKYRYVFATSNGVIYAVDWNNDLYWYRHDGWKDGSNVWTGRNLVGEGGWDKYDRIFATNNGVIYAIDRKGDLYWYQHIDWRDGAAVWKGPKLVGKGGWGDYTKVFATDEGVIYGISTSGDLWWSRHLGWETGNDEWTPGSRKKVGYGGWRQYSQVCMTNDGVLFGVDPNTSSRIKHIVYLMLENRSLDNVLGWLYPQDPELPRVVAPPGDDLPLWGGLIERTHYNLDAHGKKHWVVRGTGGSDSIPEFDPYEEHEHINNQMFEKESGIEHGEWPTMGGFYKDFATWWDKPDQIMMTYTPDDLPVLNGVAAHYGVSDAYFSSVPTQTNCNRAFAATGNSLAPHWNTGQLWAWVNNNMGGALGAHNFLVFDQSTYLNVLYDNGKTSTDDWMFFYSELWFPNLRKSTHYCFTRDMLKRLQGPKFNPHFAAIDKFYQRAKAGTLPSLSVLEPRWGLKKTPNGLGYDGNDYHPPCHVSGGEKLVRDVVSALESSPQWEETLLIINFDEHGGTYDHRPVPWNAAVPWGVDSKTPAPSKCELDFGFDRFGVRVPLILVSPYIEKNTVLRGGLPPFDHTSVIATILTLMGIPREKWELGNRVRDAPTFENVLTRTHPRSDRWSDLGIKAKRMTPETQAMDAPPSGLQREIAVRALLHYRRQQQDTRDKAGPPLAADPFEHVKTVSELNTALADALGVDVDE